MFKSKSLVVGGLTALLGACLTFNVRGDDANKIADWIGVQVVPVPE